MAMALTSRHFQDELDRLFAAAGRQGQASVDVNSGDLHRCFGVFPDPKRHRMPVCCQVMHANCRPETDEVVESPPKGKGASLTIRYRIPRT